MKTFIELLRYCENCKGAGSKKKISNKIETLSDDGKDLLLETMNPYRVFNVKKFNMPDEYATQDSSVINIIKLCDQLHDRVLTGNAARNELTRVLSYYTKESAQYLRRIFLKDPKAGFSAETVNKIFNNGNKRPKSGDFFIPVYGCMLAEKMPKATDKKKFDWSRPYIIEAKYDGQRNNTIMKNGIEDNRARSGKISDHLNGLFLEDLLKIEKVIGRPFVLDGEAMGSDFNATMNAKGSNSRAAKDDLKLYAYDIVDLDEWMNESETPTQLERSQFLEDVLEKAGTTKIIKSKWKIVNDQEEAEEFYSELLEAGYEGAVLKTLDGKYEWKRSKNWIKWKPVSSFDGSIKSFYNGRPDTRLENTLGGVVIDGVDENGQRFECRVGGGFSDEERDEIYNNQEKYIYKMIEIEASPDISIKEDRDVQSLRWGIFKKFRPDKD